MRLKKKKCKIEKIFFNSKEKLEFNSIIVIKACKMAGGSSTKVVQITNIAPQATKDQMQALFGLLGKIEEIRLCKYYN